MAARPLRATYISPLVLPGTGVRLYYLTAWLDRNKVLKDLGLKEGN
jgi:hypothetical protein